MAMWSRSILRRLIGLRAIESGTSGLRQSGVGFTFSRETQSTLEWSPAPNNPKGRCFPKVPLSASACEVSALAMALSQTHRRPWLRHEGSPFERRVFMFSGRHFDPSVIPLYVRW